MITLTDVAPVGGMTVTFSSDKAGVTVPSTVLVPAGKSSVAFVANTLVTGSSYDATITGTANLETGFGTLKVLSPAIGLPPIGMTVTTLEIELSLLHILLVLCSPVPRVLGLGCNSFCRCLSLVGHPAG